MKSLPARPAILDLWYVPAHYNRNCGCVIPEAWVARVRLACGEIVPEWRGHSPSEIVAEVRDSEGGEPICSYELVRA